MDRLDGFRDVMADPDPALVEEGDFTAASGERAMRELLGRRPDLDAVFAGNDLMAAGALRRCASTAAWVPDDVAVVGFDDMLPIAEQTEPPLTTVRQDIEEMGRLMARLLLRDLDRGATTDESEGAGPAGVVLPVTLIRRDSA